ncbi:MAG: DUF4292 domain-containing protein [Bacteroidia bacterium]|nr:DUF4292 domain-containing protein [Bacteroidia bacterium]
MTTKSPTIIIAFLAIAIISLTGCKLHKTIVTSEKKPSPAAPAEDMSGAYRQIKDHYPVYNNLLIKFSADYSGKDESHTLNGVIRIKKDTMIWVSVSAILGIEVARFIFTPDSVKYVNKLDDTYYLGNYSLIDRMLHARIDYYTLQSLITDEFFIINRKTDSLDFSNGFSGMTDNNLQCISYLSPPYQQNICYNPASSKIEKVTINDANAARTMHVAYSGFGLEDYHLPHKLSIELNSPDDQSKIEIKFGKIVLNKNLDFPFKILKEYKRTY